MRKTGSFVGRMTDTSPSISECIPARIFFFIKKILFCIIIFTHTIMLDVV